MIAGVKMHPELELAPRFREDAPSPEMSDADCAWEEYREAALKAQATLDRNDAELAGRAWAAFLDAYARIS